MRRNLFIYGSTPSTSKNLPRVFWVPQSNSKAMVTMPDDKSRDMEAHNARRLSAQYAGATFEERVKRGSVIGPVNDIPDDLKEELEQTHLDPYTPFPIDYDTPVEKRILT